MIKQQRAERRVLGTIGTIRNKLRALKALPDSRPFQLLLLISGLPLRQLSENIGCLGFYGKRAFGSPQTDM